MLLDLFNNSCVGVPTLTFISSVIMLNMLFSLYFNRRKTIYETNLSIEKDILIQSLDKEVNQITKLATNNNSNLLINNASQDKDSLQDIDKLEESVEKITHTFSQVTESLYNFLSAFHMDYGEFPDSSDIYQDNIPHIHKSLKNPNYYEYVGDSIPYMDNGVKVNNSQLDFDKFDNSSPEIKNLDYTDNFNKSNSFNENLINADDHVNEYGNPSNVKNTEANFAMYSNLI